MVRLVDEGLRDKDRFGLVGGLSSPDVALADPALGTGTFLLGVIRRVAETTEADEGEGAVPDTTRSALGRLIGFEKQLGPFVVAQLRLPAEVSERMGLAPYSPSPIPLRLHVTDTLGNPDEEIKHIPRVLAPLAESRRPANAVKRTEPITVVIGNPPYKEKTKGSDGWIENGTLNQKADAPLSAWFPPPEWSSVSSPSPVSSTGRGSKRCARNRGGTRTRFG